MEGEDTEVGGFEAQKRRILKVRLRQDQVLRLHELRILKGKSIAALLEGILEEYLRLDGTAPRNGSTMPPSGTASGNSANHLDPA